jgi:hypothetical protein
MTRYNSSAIATLRNPFEDTASIVSPALRSQMLQQADQDNGGPISDLFWLLDTPGAAVRGTLAGLKDGDFTRGLREIGANDEDRTSGRDLLREYGLAGDENTWGNFLGGLGAEIALDPTAWLSGGTKALTSAGKVAEAAGLLHDAPAALSRAYLAGEKLAPELAQRAASGADAISKSIGRTALSPTDVTGRPLIGRRAAYRYGTLGDLVESAREPFDAYRRVVEHLDGSSLFGAGRRGDAKYVLLRDKPLAKDFGFGLPLRDPSFAFNAPGGTAFNDALDAIGQYARWSPVGRSFYAFTDPKVGQAFDAESQMLYAGAADAKQAAQAAARGETTYRAAKLFQEEPDVFSEEGNRAMGRLIEDPAENKFKDADVVWNSDHPAARQYMDWWGERREELPQEFADAGLRGAIFDDPNVAGYLPRQVGNALEQAGANSPSLGRVLSTLTSDQMRRSAELMVPGGRDTIAFELSRDPFVAGAKRGAQNDQQAADHIATTLFGDPKASPGQAMELARLLHRLPDSVIRETPLFGQHPVQSISKYIEGREGALATANSIYDSLAAVAKDNDAALVEGGRHVPLSSALERIGLRTTAAEGGEIGARSQMRRRLARQLGRSEDRIELSKISVPEDMVDRLAKVRESFTSPKAAQEISNWFDINTRAWKEGILASVGRINRDLFSGAYGNWLANAFDRKSPFIAKAIAAKSAFAPEVIADLKKFPRYSYLPDGEVAAHFYEDLATTGLIDGSFLADSRSVVSGGPVVDSLIGTTPMTFTGAAKTALSGWGDVAAAFSPNSGNTWQESVSQAIDANPYLKAYRQAGNLADQINRLTGYLALLRKGVDPMEAARRMKRIHVDYSSLTPYEKWIRNKIFPFYAYTSRILAEVMRQVAERPGGRYGQTLRWWERAQERDPNTEYDGYVPEELRSQFAVPISPESMFGIPSALGTRYISGLQLPGIGELNMIDPGHVTRTVENVAQRMHPGYRAAAELLSGQDFYTKSPINEVSKGYGAYSKLARAISGNDRAGHGQAAAVLDRLIDITPMLSRPARFAARMADTDVGTHIGTRLAGEALNTAGIVRFRDVPGERIRQDAIRRLEELAAPYTKDVVIPTISEKDRPFVPQNAQDALAVARSLQNEGREIRRRRREMFKSPFE